MNKQNKRNIKKNRKNLQQKNKSNQVKKTFSMVNTYVDTNHPYLKKTVESADYNPLSDVEKVAQRVIDIYPSIEELSNHELVVKLHKGWDLSKISNKVELVSGAVHHICKSMYGLGFYKSTFFTPENDPFDVNTGKNIGGEGIIYDSQQRTHKVGYLEFIALTKVMICSFLEIPLTDEQHEVYLDFKSIPHIWSILD
tara:strand:- start:8 stop:598 length:591 start_codon:yes stop_codon:yes gene_type:complete